MDPEHLSPFESFDLAVTRVGGQSAMARVCGCTPANINQLLQNKRAIPAEYVLRAELASGVSRHALRPDVYPRGLQDDVPFVPANETSLGELLDAVADERADILHAWGHAMRRAADRQEQAA